MFASLGSVLFSAIKSRLAYLGGSSLSHCHPVWKSHGDMPPFLSYHRSPCTHLPSVDLQEITYYYFFLKLRSSCRMSLEFQDTKPENGRGDTPPVAVTNKVTLHGVNRHPSVKTTLSPRGDTRGKPVFLSRSMLHLGQMLCGIRVVFF